MPAAVRRVLFVLTATVLLGSAATVGVLAASGWRLFEIRTGSMSPVIRAGDLVLDRPAHSVGPGEVVTYRGGPDGYTTHRVSAITPDGIVTKGDANRTADWGYRTGKDIAGRVVLHIPYGGYLLRSAHSRTALGGILLLAAAVLILPPRRRAEVATPATP